MTNRKPIIAFILPDLTAGGAEMVLIRLMNGLERGKYAPIFITASERGTLRDFVDPGIPFHSLNARNVITALPKLYSKLKELKPDIVVTTMAHMNFAALLLHPFFPRMKFIVRESTLPACTLHDRGIMAPLIRILYRVLYPFAEKIIAPASIILEKMNTELGLSSTHMALLPNPIEEIEIPAHEVSDHKIHFITAGRLHHEKGFDRLIKALKDYRGPPWYLKILGEGPQRPELEHMIEALKFSENVNLPGFTKTPRSEFAKADCFLLPSRWEGLPNAALEALACGLPVIATKDAGGIQEIASQAPQGAVTIVENMQEFLKAMEAVRPLSSRRSLLPELYRQENVMKRFDNLLQEIL